MITGDHPRTAVVIAQELGISENGRVITGADLAKLTLDTGPQTVTEVSVYARVNPEHKLRIVDAVRPGRPDERHAPRGRPLPCKQHVWCPLREHDACMFLIGVAVDGAHQLSLGGERDFANPWQPFLKVVGTETALASSDQQGPPRGRSSRS